MFSQLVFFYGSFFFFSSHIAVITYIHYSQIPTKAKITGCLPSAGSWPPTGNKGLEQALTGAKLVVIPAGVPRKPGMTRDDLFNTNASIVQSLVQGCAQHCPDAVLAIISNPVNSTVPIAAQVLQQAGVYNPAKLCGVTTLDVIRANTFVREHMMRGTASSGNDNDDATTSTNVTVVGGHAGITILPLFSQVPQFQATPAQLEALTVRTQFGGDEVVQAKAGAGSATLSMAYAGFLFAQGVLRGLAGEANVVQCAFVESNLTAAPFFASPCKFGVNGVEQVLPLGKLSAYEQQWFDKMMPELQKQIQKGVDFANKNKNNSK